MTDFAAIRHSTPISPGQVRAVLFDVDGTLYHQTALRACVAAELAASALVPRWGTRIARVARILRVYRRVHEELRGRGTYDDALGGRHIAESAARAGCSEHEVEAVVGEWMQRRPLQYLRRCRRRNLVAVLRHLQQRGIGLGVLSDYPAGDKLVALGVANFFSLVLCTSDPEIGALKPDPRGFARACQLWELAPDEVLYVGDRPEVDARGALAAGLRSAILGPRRHHGAANGIPIRGLGDIVRLVGV